MDGLTGWIMNDEQDFQGGGLIMAKNHALSLLHDLPGDLGLFVPQITDVQQNRFGSI